MKRLYPSICCLLSGITVLTVLSGPIAPSQAGQTKETIRVRTRSAPAPLQTVSFSQLPLEAQTTIAQVRQNRSFASSVVFNNSARILPIAPKGYYREYRMLAQFGGEVQRVVIGQSGDIYYAGGRYRRLVRIQ